jgi:hypothetical protein
VPIVEPDPGMVRGRPEQLGEGSAGRVAPLLDRSAWMGVVVVGVLLFAVGVYLGLAATGAIPSNFPRSEALDYVPFVFTIGGGALGMYGYEAWAQHPDAVPAKPKRRPEESLREIPSFEIIPPPREGDRP